ncbi:hypothetical protein AAHA92_20026 [Salvia divinorum]|uniref:Uncharacterized protein n=1 Tax=Salvia divinorum TaxID=28513 RepID=A0ABD1GFW9_SALDI
MVFTRIEIVAVLLLMTLLISSQAAEAQHLNPVPSQEGENMMALRPRFKCPYGCCGRARSIYGQSYCRCCPYPANTHFPTKPHA